MLLGTSAFAQVSIGAGYVNSKQTLKSGNASYAMPSNGFYAGFDYNVPVGDVLGLSAGVNFEYLMSKDYSLGSYISGDFKEQYINAPIRLNLGFDVADGFRFLAFAGPTFSYALTGQVSAGSLSYDLYKNSNYNRFDVLVGGGVGFELMDRVRLTAGYDFGMFNKYPKNSDGSESSITLNRNRIHAGIAFLF